MTPSIPEKEQKKVRKDLELARRKMENIDQLLASKDLAKLEKLDKLDVPMWVKPFVSNIMKNVQEQVSTSLGKIADELFGAGIFSLSEALHDVAKERGITNEGILRLIKALPEFEALLYYFNVRKFYRDHCAHQLRVAVLGDFLLDLTSPAGGIEGIIKDKIGLSSEQVRTAWWFAGLLHDTGIPLAKLSVAVNWSLINEILRCYPSLDIQTRPISFELTGEQTENGQYLSILANGLPESWKTIVRKGLGVAGPMNEPKVFKGNISLRGEYQPPDQYIDHGVVSAVNLLRTLGPAEKLQKNLPEDIPLIEAARAMCLHNFKNELRDVPFEDYPLVFLLILVDELQEWARPVPVPIKDTYFTTSLQKVALVDSIFYARTDATWDIPYSNAQAKNWPNSISKNSATIRKAT